MIMLDKWFLSSFTLSILATFIAVVLRQASTRKGETSHAVRAFVLLSCVWIVRMVAAVGYDDSVRWVASNIADALFPFVIAVFLRFTYSTEDDIFRQEARWIVGGYTAAAAIAVISAIGLNTAYLAAPHRWADFRSFMESPVFISYLNVLGLLGIGGFVWCVVVLLRKTYRFSRSNTTSITRADNESSSHLSERIPDFTRFLVKPRGRSARATRAYALVPLIPLITEPAAEWLSPAIRSGALFLLAMYVFFAVHANYARVPVPLVGRVTLGAMLVLLVTVHLVGYTTIVDHRDVFERGRAEAIRAVAPRIAAGDFTPEELPPWLVYIVRGRADQGHFGTDIEILHARTGSDVDRVSMSRARRYRLSETLFDAIRSGVSPGAEGVADLWVEENERLRAFGIIRASGLMDSYRYRPLRTVPDFTAYPWVSGEAAYEAGYEFRDGAVVVRRATMRMAVLVAGGIVLVLLSTRLFFRRNLTVPLNRLLEAVGRIKADDLDVSLPVESRDEIGAVTEALNDMVISVRDARDRLVRMNSANARFVPSDLLHLLGKQSIVDLSLGECIEREMTVLFLDVRSFTTLSETMSAEENFNFINQLLGTIGPVVRHHGGAVDKYLGDGLMALFPTKPDDAISAAFVLLRTVRELNSETGGNGGSPVRIGIGIHTGTVMLGTVGEAERMDTTVISDTVNVASRLQDLTKEYPTDLIVSEATVRGLDDAGSHTWEELGRVRVKGREAMIAILTPLESMSS